MRWLITGFRLLKAKFRDLLVRSTFVIRHEGISGFARRSIGFVGRYLQRKSAAKQLVRFQGRTETALSGQNVPLVSFVIPIYDRTDVLRTSINSALRQSLQVFEVILVTDGSPSATLAVVGEFRSDPRVRIFNYPVSSGNAVRGRNKGILEARGRYIAFLDSDDVAAPDRLEVCLPILESGQADVVYGGWRAMLDGTREIDGLTQGQVVHSPDCDLAMLKQVCVPCQSTVMVRREVLLRTGFLKPRMQYREDHELWVRLAHHGAKFKSIPYVLTDLRLHSGNNELKFKHNDSHWESLLSEEYQLQGPLPKKIAFLFAGVGISGGAAVVLKHISMLLDEGHDAFVINVGITGDISWFGNPAIRVYGGEEIPNCGLYNIDLLFATFWTTVEWLDKISARRKLYFVQSDERLFYDQNVLKAAVQYTYSLSYEYIAIAGWIVEFLTNEFNQSVTYIPNGIDSGLFYPDKPLVAKKKRRLRVLIEGPISVPFKGVSDAYEAVKDLDADIWIVSSDGKPHPKWRYDRFFESVNQFDMRAIYSSCDILLKMSQVESFAYPPLEAMACGCAVVLGDVSGGIEYASDGFNVLKVPKGDIVAAHEAVQVLLHDSDLRARLIKSGYETVKCWSWGVSKIAMLNLINLE
jgi:glycosyltransferase involved in cell wall biosynthesis